MSVWWTIFIFFLGNCLFSWINGLQAGEGGCFISTLFILWLQLRLLNWIFPSAPPPRSIPNYLPDLLSTLSSLGNFPTTKPHITKIFPFSGRIPNLNKGLLDDWTTSMSHSITHLKNILWGFTFGQTPGIQEGGKRRPVSLCVKGIQPGYVLWKINFYKRIILSIFCEHNR